MLCISSDRSMHDSIEKGLTLSANFSASILEKSSTSETSASKVCDVLMTMSVSSRCSAVRSGMCDSSSLPAMMALSGVRISWLMFARNEDLARTIASLFSLASFICNLLWNSSVMSRAVTSTTMCWNPALSIGKCVIDSTTRRGSSWL